MTPTLSAVRVSWPRFLLLSTIVNAPGLLIALLLGPISAPAIVASAVSPLLGVAVLNAYALPPTGTPRLRVFAATLGWLVTPLAVAALGLLSAALLVGGGSASYLGTAVRGVAVALALGGLVLAVYLLVNLAAYPLLVRQGERGVRAFCGAACAPGGFWTRVLILSMFSGVPAGALAFVRLWVRALDPSVPPLLLALGLALGDVLALASWVFTALALAQYARTRS